jgi:ribonuclease HI
VTRAVLRSDGGARGNPGPAGAGFVIEVDGSQICAGGRYLGETTNNVAEYLALIWGLENALALGVSQLTVFADSELLVKQINGVYRVKNEGLKPLFLEALTLLRQFTKFEVKHVRREDNKAADEMANLAMDARDIVGNPKCPPGGAAPQESLF